MGNLPRNFWILAFTAVIFLIYVLTLYPGVAGGDSGELIINAYGLGVAHPPGYPLYTLLGHLMTWLPFGSVAWRVNLLSAVLDALAAGLLFRLSWRITKDAWAGAVACGIYAFSPLIWSYAVTAEVFPLNNFFIAVLLNITWSFVSGGRRWQTAALAFFVSGLALSNHHTFIFVAAPILIWMLWTLRVEKKFFKMLFGFSFLAILGLSPYLYLFWAGSRGLSISWGDTGTWDGFLTHILRQEYGTFRLAISNQESQFWPAFKIYFQNSYKELLGMGAYLIISGGFLKKFKKNKSINKDAISFYSLTLFIFSFYLLVFHLLTNLNLTEPLYVGIMERFWQQPHFFLSLFVGACFAGLFSYLKPVLAVAFIGIQIGWNYPHQDQHQNRILEQAGRQILENLPPSTILMPLGDADFGITRYLQACEGLRTDVKIISRSLIGGYPWATKSVMQNFPDVILPAPGYAQFYKMREGGYKFETFLDLNLPHHPVYVSAIGQKEETDWLAKYQLWPIGFVDRVVLKNPSPADNDYVRATDQIWKNIDFESLKHFPKTSWEYFFRQRYEDSQARRGELLMRISMRQVPKNIKLLAESAKIIDDLMLDDKSPLPGQLKLQGFIWSQLIGNDPRAATKTRAAWEKYLILASPQDPDYLPLKNSLQAIPEK